MTLLHRAAQSPDPAVVALLLDWGADLQARDNRGDTPLRLAAAFNDNPAVAALLLDRGADAKLRDKEDTMSDRYARYQALISSSKTEKLEMWLGANLFLPTSVRLILRLVQLSEPDPDVQMVKKGWSWPAHSLGRCRARREGNSSDLLRRALQTRGIDYPDTFPGIFPVKIVSAFFRSWVFFFGS